MKATVTTTKKHIARKLKSLTGKHFSYLMVCKPVICVSKALYTAHTSNHTRHHWIAVIHHIILDLYLTNHHVWSHITQQGADHFIFSIVIFQIIRLLKKNFPLEFACLVFLKPKFWLTLAWHKKNWISLHTSLNQNHYNGDIWQSQNPELRSVEIFCHYKDYGSRGITSRRKTKKTQNFL